MIIYNGNNDNLLVPIKSYNAHLKCLQKDQDLLSLYFPIIENHLIEILDLSKKHANRWYEQNKLNLLEEINSIIQLNKKLKTVELKPKIAELKAMIESQINGPLDPSWSSYFKYQFSEIGNGGVDTIRNPIKALKKVAETIVADPKSIDPKSAAKYILNEAYEHPLRTTSNILASLGLVYGVYRIRKCPLKIDTAKIVKKMSELAVQADIIKKASTNALGEMLVNINQSSNYLFFTTSQPPMQDIVTECVDKIKSVMLPS